MAYASVELAGTYQLTDGTPAVGIVEIIPSERLIVDDAGDVVLSGRIKVQLDASGSFSVDLPATDDPALTPTGFGYTLAARLYHTHLPAVSFSLPAAVPIVDVTDVTTVDPSTFAPDANYVSAVEMTALDGRVDVVEAALPGKADDADVTALDTRVDAAEGEIAGRLSAPTLSATIAAASLAGTPVGAVPVAKPAADGRTGVWEYTHNDTTGYLFHLLAGSGMGHNQALIAMGVDNDGIGLLIPNKKTGRAIVIDQQAGITSATAYGIHATQNSALAPLVRLEMNTNTAADVLQLIAFGAPGVNQRLLYASDPVGDAWSIFASDGRMRGQRTLRIFGNPSNAADSFIEVSTASTANSSNTRKTFLGSNAHTGFGSSGSAGVYYPYQIFHQSSAMSLRVGPTITAADASNPVPSEIGTLQEAITLRYSGGARQIGLYGVTPVARAAAIASPAADAAALKTAVDAIRVALTNIGVTS